MSSGEKPPARFFFRMLAAGLAVFCFVVAAWLATPPRPDNWLLKVGVCLLFGAFMAVIAITGYWPPQRKEEWRKP